MHWMTRVALGLAAAASLAAAGEAPPEAPPGAGRKRIIDLCKKLGEGQYGSIGACKQLIRVGRPAMPYLLKTLKKDPRYLGRSWAVVAISNIASDEGYEAVVEAFRNDKNDYVRCVVIWHLRHFRKKDKDIWPLVEEALLDKSGEVGRWALRLMFEDSDPPVKGGYKKLDEALRKALASGKPGLQGYALDHIRGLLKESVKGDTEKARGYLDPVLKLLAAPEPSVRYDALHTAVLLMAKGQFELIRKTYEKDTSPVVHEGALRCITVLSEPPVEAIELLILGLGSKDLKVRTAAVGLLRKGCYGRYHGYSPEQTEDNRNEAIGKWTDWYRANRTKLKWAPDYRKFLLPGQEPE